MNSKRVVSTDPASPVPQDTIAILESVIEERDRAMHKWGVQSHPDGTGGKAAEMLALAQKDIVDEQARSGSSNWRDILMEEVREAFAESDLVALDNELCQVMQVCLVWREDIARRQGQIAVLGTTKEVHDDKVWEALSQGGISGEGAGWTAPF